jgi:ankyrin repeat protein
VKEVDKRCDIYRERIAKHLEKVKKAEMAKKRNIEYNDIAHKVQKQKISELQIVMKKKLIDDACDFHLIENMLFLINNRGANPNQENKHGLTPLISLVLNDANIEQFDSLITNKSSKVDLNAVNKHGLSALMYAVRLKEKKIVHILMKSGAAVNTKGFISIYLIIYF